VISLEEHFQGARILGGGGRAGMVRENSAFCLGTQHPAILLAQPSRQQRPRESACTLQAQQAGAKAEGAAGCDAFAHGLR
jgi:hypothetical protein